MHILISPNAFKNTLTATEAAAAILEGLQQSRLSFTYELFPVGDGGDGTGDLLIERFHGRDRMTSALDPIGRPLTACYGLIEQGDTAIIEMTYASGLKHLRKHELDPLTASSYGTGQLMKDAVQYGVKKIVIPMGGSATVDGGTGILRALGYRFYDSNGQELHYIMDMHRLQSIKLSLMHEQLNSMNIIVLCDVNNPLTGSSGAAAVYGPQKGADEKAVAILDRSLEKLAMVMEQTSGLRIIDLPGAGTAGGAAAGLHAMLQAELVRGIDYFLDTTSFDESLSKADLVITGEGSLDSQTMQGKAPFGVATRARAAGKRTACLAGILPAPPDQAMQDLFDLILPTLEFPTLLTRDRAYQNLRQTARRLAMRIEEIV